MDAMDLVFHALAHPLRRSVLDRLKDRPGQSVNEIAENFDVSRIAVIKHLQVLEQAQLILVRRNGRRKELFFNVVPIQAIYDRWTDEYGSFWAGRMLDLKRKIERETGTKPPAHRKRSLKKRTRSGGKP